MPECGLPLPCESTVASDSNALTITNSGIGSAIRAIGTNSEESAAAVTAIHTGGGSAIAASANETEIAVGVLNNGGSIGVMGFCTRDSFSIGVHGESRVEGVGVHGECDSEGSTGVSGRSRDGNGVTGTSTTNAGVVGKSDITAGVFGIADAQGDGVVGAGENGNGVFGIAEFGTGVAGHGIGGLNPGVYGNGPIGVFGESPVEGGTGVVGAGQFRAAFFDGDVHINGVVIFGDGGVRIDHPLEPASRYLSHALVGSPEMKNVYDGVVALDEHGECRVELPEWFEAVNCDFRYQLTSIGEPAPNLHVAREISNNHFNIAGGKSGMKVSWQVTGIRKDAWAQAHPLSVEEEKPENERGYICIRSCTINRVKTALFGRAILN